MSMLTTTLRQQFLPLLARPLTGAFTSAGVGLARFSTSIPRAAAATKAAPPVNEAPIIVPELQLPRPKGPITNGNLIEVISKEQIARLDPTGEKRALVLRRSAERIQPGDVLAVESYTSRTKGTTTHFMGVCIGLFRRGVDTTVLVRNIIERVGVEFRIPVFSPMVKRIEILRRGTGYRRAKLFYLRNQPGKAFQLNKLRRTHMLELKEERAKAAAATKSSV